MREKPVTLRFRFDEIDARNEVRVVLVNRYVGAGQLAFEPPHLGGLNEHRTDPEFLCARPFWGGCGVLPTIPRHLRWPVVRRALSSFDPVR
jgi:hypothetical protein